MIATCFARALQRYTSRIYMHFLLTFQEVRPITKTRNQFSRSIALIMASATAAALPRREDRGVSRKALSRCSPPALSQGHAASRDRHRQTLLSEVCAARSSTPHHQDPSRRPSSSWVCSEVPRGILPRGVVALAYVPRESQRAGEASGWQCSKLFSCCVPKVVCPSTDPPRDADGTIGDDPWGSGTCESRRGCRTRFSWVADVG